jgi:hypothetical protein
MSFSSKSTECLPPASSTSTYSQSIKETTATTSARKPSTHVRKYNPSHLFFGFTYTGEESVPVPQCVICYETLSNHPMHPSLLMRHFRNQAWVLKTQASGTFPKETVRFISK